MTGLEIVVLYKNYHAHLRIFLTHLFNQDFNIFLTYARGKLFRATLPAQRPILKSCLLKPL